MPFVRRPLEIGLFALKELEGQNKPPFSVRTDSQSTSTINSSDVDSVDDVDDVDDLNNVVPPVLERTPVQSESNLASLKDLPAVNLLLQDPTAKHPSYLQLIKVEGVLKAQKDPQIKELVKANLRFVHAEIERKQLDTRLHIGSALAIMWSLVAYRNNLKLTTLSLPLIGLFLSQTSTSTTLKDDVSITQSCVKSFFEDVSRHFHPDPSDPEFNDIPSYTFPS